MLCVRVLARVLHRSKASRTEGCEGVCGHPGGHLSVAGGQGIGTCGPDPGPPSGCSMAAPKESLSTWLQHCPLGFTPAAWEPIPGTLHSNTQHHGLPHPGHSQGAEGPGIQNQRLMCPSLISGHGCSYRTGLLHGDPGVWANCPRRMGIRAPAVHCLPSRAYRLH